MKFQGLIKASHCLSLQKFCSAWVAMGMVLSMDVVGDKKHNYHRTQLSQSTIQCE